MYLEPDHLRKHFDDREVVRGPSPTLEQGQFLCILGVSGCGKTTILNMIGGFLDSDSGSVRPDGEDIVRIPSEQRPVTIVFQLYGPFPYTTVLQNVIYGLKLRGVKWGQARQKGIRYLETAGLVDYVRAYIQEISGGQQQRMTLARALIVEPKLCLLDEPLCNLGATLHTKIRHELKWFQKALGLTMALVTHDQEEAIILADRIAIMDQGELVQNDALPELCRRPASPSIAEFTDLKSLVWTEDGRLFKIIKR